MASAAIVTLDLLDKAQDIQLSNAQKSGAKREISEILATHPEVAKDVRNALMSEDTNPHAHDTEIQLLNSIAAKKQPQRDGR